MQAIQESLCGFLQIQCWCLPLSLAFGLYASAARSTNNLQYKNHSIYRCSLLWADNQACCFLKSVEKYCCRKANRKTAHSVRSAQRVRRKRFTFKLFSVSICMCEWKSHRFSLVSVVQLYVLVTPVKITFFFVVFHCLLVSILFMVVF